MRHCGFRIILGVLGALVLWGPPCQAQGPGGQNGWSATGLASYKLNLTGQTSRFWSCSMSAVDRSLGYDRPWQAKLDTLDPDLSAAYALGGGFNFFLKPKIALHTSLHFLWRKIDGATPRTTHAHLGTSGLSDLNIRAVNLVIGLQAQF